MRSVSLFVVAFLGLNPAAVFCLAYCNFHVQAATAEHCPLKKKSADCHQTKTAATPLNAPSFDSGSVNSCVIPLNVIAAPVESKYGVTVSTAVTLPFNETVFAPVRLIESRQIPKSYYHPPPNDLRSERVRNQVFRI